MKIKEERIRDILQREQISFKENDSSDTNIKKIFELDTCLKGHPDSGKIIFWKNGHVSYKCHHDSCKLDNIVLFLEKYDPALLNANKPCKESGTSGEIKEPLQFINGADLAAVELPQIRWIVQDFLPAGLSKLCGEPKTYKSYMALDLCLSVCLGRPFLGKKTIQAGAVYYDLEANKRRAQTRQRQILGTDPAPSNFYVHCGMEGIALIGEGFEDDLVHFLDDHPDIALVVIDVFIKIRPSRKQSELLQKEYLDTQKLWQIANKRNICIILIEHTNKNTGAKAFDRIAGANTSRGSTDTNMVIIREEDSDTDAVLSVEGREIPTDRYVIRWDVDLFRWQLDGRYEELKKQREIDKAYHIFLNHDAVKTIRQNIKDNNYWSGYMQDLVDEAECDISPKKMGLLVKMWTDHKFFERENVKAEKRFINGKWRYTFKTL